MSKSKESGTIVFASSGKFIRIKEIISNIIYCVKSLFCLEERQEGQYGDLVFLAITFDVTYSLVNKKVY